MKDDKLAIPVSLVREWDGHANHGTEFKAWLAEFTKKYTVIDPVEEGKKKEEQDEAKKRALQKGLAPPPAKKVKLSNDILVALDAIQKPMLYEVKLNKETIFAQIRADKEIYLVNKSDKDFSADHAQVAGFGRGASSC